MALNNIIGAVTTCAVGTLVLTAVGIVLLLQGALFAAMPSSSHLAPLSAADNNAQVITCGTSRLRTPFDFTKKNVCKNKKWKGFGWKLKQFLKYAKTQPSDTLLVLVDAKDVFVNHRELQKFVWSRFDNFNTDVIISSDEICRTELCNNAQRKRLFMRNIPLSRSAFANSAMAGRAWALVEVITSMLRPDWSDAADDQLLAIDVIIKPRYTLKARVALDVNQLFFGSFAHVQPVIQTWFTRFVDSIPFKTNYESNYICTDGLGRLFHTCSRVPIVARDDISITLMDNVQYVVDPRSCSVKRFESTLGFNPIIWHGNWLGRQVFNAVQKRRAKCLKVLR